MKAYHQLSTVGKVLLFVAAATLILTVFHQRGTHEGFHNGVGIQKDKFLLKSDIVDIYDDFYAQVYDYLVFNNVKNEYEVGQIVNLTKPGSQSRILDIGCGTGHHTAALASQHLDVLGIDISPSMVKKAKENYPHYSFEVADALQGGTFAPESFSHILCLYFTVYYLPNKAQFFENCFHWLVPGGYLVVHLVDRDQFDPILPPGNPLMYVSPQRYAKERITSTKVKFTDFAYSANFKLESNKNRATFTEKFKDDRTGNVRQNEHVFYMPPASEIIQEAQACGFIVESQVDLLQASYEFQNLVLFVKPG